MIDLEKTALHRVYKTEHLGDALVVTLQGDSAGFSIVSVHNEMVTVIGLARSLEVRNLIIDMSGSNYYGSLILGEIVNLAQAVKEKGGRVALAGISPDMKEVLRMMRLDAMWERYPTRSMAVRALANLPWQQRLKPYAKPLAIVGVVAVLVALYLYLPRKDHTPDYYQSITRIWDEAKALRAVKASDSEWLGFNEHVGPKLQDMSRRLNKIASPSKPNLQYLLWVTRDYGPNALNQRLDPQKDDTQIVEYYLSVVKSHLEHTAPLPRPKALGADPFLAPGGGPAGAPAAFPPAGLPEPKSAAVK